MKLESNRDRRLGWTWFWLVLGSILLLLSMGLVFLFVQPQLYTNLNQAGSELSAKINAILICPLPIAFVGIVFLAFGIFRKQLDNRFPRHTGWTRLWLVLGSILSCISGSLLLPEVKKLLFSFPQPMLELPSFLIGFLLCLLPMAIVGVVFLAFGFFLPKYWTKRQWLKKLQNIVKNF